MGVYNPSQITHMKRLLIIALLALCHFTTWSATYRVDEIPNVQLENRYRFTSNPDGILSNDAVAHIDSVCFNLREEGLVQIAVVAVEDIKGGDVFDFAYELFSTWGVGSKSDRGLGILLVEDEREIRFVTGYGIEGTLPDALCKRIQTDYMLPYFREGDYSGGMMAGISAIGEVMRNGELPAEFEEDEDLTALFWFMGSIFLLIVILLAYWIYIAAHKCPNCKRPTLQQQDSRLLSRKSGICTYEDTLTCTHCGATVKRKRQTGDSSYTGRGGRGPFIGGGFGGHGGGRIGGGWGGGSFGGGGAGSQW